MSNALYMIDKTPACRVILHYRAEVLSGAQRTFTLPMREVADLLRAHNRGRHRWLGEFLSVTDLDQVAAIDVIPVPTK